MINVCDLISRARTCVRVHARACVLRYHLAFGGGGGNKCDFNVAPAVVLTAVRSGRFEMWKQTTAKMMRLLKLSRVEDSTSIWADLMGSFSDSMTYLTREMLK